MAMKLAADTDEPSSLFEGLDWLNLPKLKQDSSVTARFALQPLSSNVAAQAAGTAACKAAAAANTKAHIAPVLPALQLPQQFDQQHAHQQPARTFNRSRAAQQRPSPALSTLPATAAAILPGSKPSLSNVASSPAQHTLKTILHSFDFPASDSDEDPSDKPGLASASEQQQLQPTATLQPSQRKAPATFHSRCSSKPKQAAGRLQQLQQEEQQQEEGSMHQLRFNLPGIKQTVQQGQPLLGGASPAAAAGSSNPASKLAAAGGSKSASKPAAAPGGSPPASKPAAATGSKPAAAGPSWLLPLGVQGGKQGASAAEQTAAAAGAGSSRALQGSLPSSSDPSTALTEPTAHSMRRTDRHSSKPSTQQQQTATGHLLPGSSGLLPLGGSCRRSSMSNKAVPAGPPAALLPPLPAHAPAGATQSAQQHAPGRRLQAGQPLAAAAAARARSARSPNYQQQQQQQEHFAIFSADGEMELVMESPASPAASLSTSQQQQQQDRSLLAAASMGTSQQHGQQGRCSLLAAAHLGTSQQQHEPAGGSQGTSSEGAHVAAGNSSSYSSSGSSSRSGSGSDGEEGATASSGSLWSGDSGGAAGGSSSSCEGGGSDSDAEYVKGEGRKRRGSGALGAGLGRAKARKLQQQQGKVPELKLQLPQLPITLGSKGGKSVRFAEGSLPAAAKKQGLLLQGLEEGAGEVVEAGKGSSRLSSRGAGKAAATARVLESSTVLPGEVPLLLPSAHALLRSGILLVELPAGFDAEGDAGAIGRVVCTSAGPAADGHAVARISSRPPDRLRQAPMGKAANSKAGAAGADGDAAVSSDSLDEEEDGESDSQSDQEDSEAAHGSDEAPPSGIPALDLKGMFYDIQELALAGTAAVVRINAPGKGSAGKPASAHMEHLLSSFLRATPSAAAAAAAEDWDTADGYDWEADEAGAAWDPMDCDAVAMQLGAEGLGQQGGAGAVGAKGRGKGAGAGRKARGPAGGGGARKSKGAAGAGAGRKGGVVKKKGAGRKPRAQKQGKKAVGVGAAAARGAGGAKAAKAVGGGAEGARKPGAGNKQAKKDPWETDSGISDSE